MSSPNVKFTPECVEIMAKGIEQSAYECPSCKKIIYPAMEITPEGKLQFEISVNTLLGYICPECAEKREINVKKILETSGTTKCFRVESKMQPIQTQLEKEI